MDLKYAIGAALAAGVFAAQPVVASDASSSAAGASSQFDSLDKNNDGNLDPTEAQAVPGLQQNFSKYDTDHNGKLGKDEFAAALSALRSAGAGASSPASASSQFDTLDKNNDGNLDPTEAQAVPGLQQNFSQYDTDHNGKLGKDEFAAAMSALGSAPGVRWDAARASSEFDKLDKNNDGGLDQTELQSMPAVKQNFSQYDTNHDGKLGKDEFAAAVNAQSAAVGATKP